MGQEKRLKVGGNARIEFVGTELRVIPEGGLVFVTCFDLTGTVLYTWHPPSGWYVEMNLREPKEGVTETTLDRKQACNQYTALYPADEYDADIHHLVSDYNFEDHWLFEAISVLSNKLNDDEENEDLRRRMFWLVDLLKLPLPPHWDDEWDEDTPL